MDTEELAIYPHLVHTQHLIAATLEMAVDAERLHRFPQAEQLYNRALILSEATYDQPHVQAVSILWDLARVCEKQNRPRDAEQYYNRVITLGFSGRNEISGKAA